MDAERRLKLITRAVEDGLVRLAQPDSDGMVLPMPHPVRTHRSGLSDIDVGLVYQKCGGGRRVIRKRIGGN